MAKEISERDWRRWRDIAPQALERLCGRVVEEAASFAQRTGSAHSRYLKPYRYIADRDEEIGRIFNNRKRSIA